RRRHTRFSRDWSSDVCSSDLAATAREGADGEEDADDDQHADDDPDDDRDGALLGLRGAGAAVAAAELLPVARLRALAEARRLAGLTRLGRLAVRGLLGLAVAGLGALDRKSTRLNSS